jgi:hypothetical protein
MTLRNPLLVRQTMRQWLLWLIIVLTVCGSLVAFVLVVNPSLKDENNYRIGADSKFYLWGAGLVRDNPSGSNYDAPPSLVAVGSNLLGPILIATVFRDNFSILCFNYFVLFCAIYCVRLTRCVDCAVLSILLLVNPLILVSVLTLNKEILAVAASMLLYCYLDRRRKSRLLLAMLLTISLLARWEHLLLVLIFLVITSQKSRFNQHRGMALIAIILLITVCYPFISGFINLSFGSEPLEGSTIVKLTDLQAHFLYLVVAIPKLLMNLYGGMVGFLRNAEDGTDIYNVFVVPWGCLVNAVVTMWFLLKRRGGLSRDMLFFAAIYGVILSASPFVQTRYFIPIYVILCVEIATRVGQDVLPAQTREVADGRIGRFHLLPVRPLPRVFPS